MRSLLSLLVPLTAAVVAGCSLGEDDSSTSEVKCLQLATDLVSKATAVAQSYDHSGLCRVGFMSSSGSDIAIQLGGSASQVVAACEHVSAGQTPGLAKPWYCSAPVQPCRYTGDVSVSVLQGGKALDTFVVKDAGDAPAGGHAHRVLASLASVACSNVNGKPTPTYRLESGDAPYALLKAYNAETAPGWWLIRKRGTAELVGVGVNTAWYFGYPEEVVVSRLRLNGCDPAVECPLCRQHWIPTDIAADGGAADIPEILDDAVPLDCMDVVADTTATTVDSEK